MKEKLIPLDGMEISYREFMNIHEFYRYISESEISELYRFRQLMSERESEDFTGTKNFEEAMYMLKNGWKDMSREINEKVGKLECTGDGVRKKQVYDVVGYQPSVPRYLQGLPTNMIRSKNVIEKNKVIVINKLISYDCNVQKVTIVEESVKMLSVINKIEQSGKRCRVNIVLGTYDDYGMVRHYEIVKVCIKEPRERLNISKMSFLLVHPSMLRRIFFRYIEVSKTVTQGFTGYGYPVSSGMVAVSKVCSGEYVLPTVTSYGLEGIIKDIDMFFVKTNI